MKLSNIAYVFFQLLLIIAAAMVPSLVLSLIDGDGLALTWGVQIGSMTALSLFFRLLNLKPRELSIREGFVIVAFGWVFVALCGAIPFMASGFIPRLEDAYFETMSGFTTTGATILSNIEALPRSLLLWRSMTHWLGGMGVIVLAVAIFPFLGVGAFQLFKTESPGPIKGKLVPRASESAKILWRVYVAMTFAEVVLLVAGGLPVFEAVCVTFGTMATGGYATRNASIAAYPSPFVHYVIVVFMFLAGANFALHYSVVRGKPGRYLKDSEFKFYFGVVVCATVAIMASQLFAGVRLSEDLFRGSLFQVVSIITTTGFITKDYDLWPVFAQATLFVLMFIGGCAGSTGGAIKNVRVVAVLKSVGLEVKKLLVPHSVQHLKLDGRVVDSGVGSAIMAFVSLYMLTFLIGFFAIMALGLDMVSAAGAVACTLGNVGPGLGTVGATDNFGPLSAVTKWVLSFLMMMGRLELFPVIVVFSRNFWR